MFKKPQRPNNPSASWWQRISTYAASMARRVIHRTGPWRERLLAAGGGYWERFKQQLRAWRNRWRGLPPEDVAHVFRARNYPGSRQRQYVVHPPRGKSTRRPRPLLMVLHGCKQTHHDIERLTGFNELADAHGFYVVYPFITSYRGLRFKNCWGWWMREEIHAGSGEVEDLWQIVEEVRREYPINARRIHIAGLSSGAGMTVAALVAHHDKFASGAAVAGVPYTERAEAVKTLLNRFPRYRPIANVVSAMQKEMGEAGQGIALQIVHSRQDETVDIQAAKNLRDSWAECFAIDTATPIYQQAGRQHGVLWEHNKYAGQQRRSQLETVFLQGPGHGWYGGNPGEYSFPEAPDVAAMIWKFFKLHPLPE